MHAAGHPKAAAHHCCWPTPQLPRRRWFHGGGKGHHRPPPRFPPPMYALPLRCEAWMSQSTPPLGRPIAGIPTRARGRGKAGQTTRERQASPTTRFLPRIYRENHLRRICGRLPATHPPRNFVNRRHRVCGRLPLGSRGERAGRHPGSCVRPLPEHRGTHHSDQHLVERRPQSPLAAGRSASPWAWPRGHGQTHNSCLCSQFLLLSSASPG